MFLSSLQDEDDGESQSLTPHQTPPSTASIPPSLSVTQSGGGGVGHTTSTHVPLVTGQSQLLTQLPPLAARVPLPPHPQAPPTPQQQQLASPQLPLSTLQPPTPSLGAVTPPTGSPLPPRTLATGIPNYQAFAPQGAGVGVLTPPSLPPTRPGQQQQQQLPPGQPTPPTAAIPQPPLGFSALSMGLHQLSQAALLQQRQQLALRHVQRGLAGRTSVGGAPEVTPPPAKRHAPESPYHPGLPQPATAVATAHQLLAAAGGVAPSGVFPPQVLPPTNYQPQQQQQQQTASHMFASPSSSLHSPLPPPHLPPSLASSTQLRPPQAPPTLPGGFRGRTGAPSMGWQPK